MVAFFNREVGFGKTTPDTWPPKKQNMCWFQPIRKKIPLRKPTCPLKKDPFKRKVDFQPSFLSGYVSFRGVIKLDHFAQ